MKRMSTLTSEGRNDLHLTTTGVSHAARQIQPFPSPTFGPLHTTLPLPPPLSSSSSHAPTVNDVYRSTTATDHCYQPHVPHLQQPQYLKPAAHAQVHYNLDTVDKLNSRPSYPLLTMANQTTEMRGNYRGNPEIISRVVPQKEDPQLPVLSDHFKGGPNKELVASTTNKKMQWRVSASEDLSVLDRNQPYQTTNTSVHRALSREERLQCRRADAATFWQCEDYPKTWGFGVRENPLTKTLSGTEWEPMRDRTVFRTGSNIPRVPPSLEPISTSKRSVYADTYTSIDTDARNQLFHCPITSPVAAKGYDSTLAHQAPLMYQSMNMTYGSQTTVNPETVG